MNSSSPATGASTHPGKLIEFGEFILARREDITRHWVTAVDRSPEVASSEDLTYRQLLDHLPQLCTELAHLLREPGADLPQNETVRYSKTHGAKRWKQGYRLEEVIREICIIRNDFLGRWFEAFEAESGPLESEAKRTAHRIVRRFFDDVIVGSASQYVEEQQSRLLASEAALVEQIERAEMAAIARNKFLAMIGHELRTPLTPVLLGASVLSVNETLSPEMREIALVIAHNAKLEAAFIDDLLDAGRLARGPLQLHLGEVELHACLDAAIASTHPEFSSKNLILHVALESAPRPLLQGDAARLQRAFASLLRNAANVSAAGGSVFLRTRDDDAVVEITVEDSGAELDEETMREMFLPFAEERRPQFAIEGLGVSRYVCRATIEAHGGTIAVTPAGAAAGAVFTVRLPRKVQ